jgi:hypothetical protein
LRGARIEREANPALLLKLSFALLLMFWRFLGVIIFGSAIAETLLVCAVKNIYSAGLDSHARAESVHEI